MLHRALVFVGLSLSAPILFAGCGSSASGNDVSSGTPTPIHRSNMDDASDELLPQGAVQDTGGAQDFQGSVLCHASRLTGCYPDDVVNACDLALDAGASDADADIEGAPGCHVIGEGADQHTACLPGGYGMNSSCMGPSDCSAGHECINGTCRHYCCSGTAACSSGQFCDVQPTEADPKTLVPVCMPVIPCTLLDEDSCPASQQCSVVREDGTTGCVAIGNAQDSEPCDTEHCARGLVCIGASGLRRCATLCYTALVGQCLVSGQSCLGSLPLFPDPKIGVCQ
jgi:hypothetical protein